MSSDTGIAGTGANFLGSRRPRPSNCRKTVESLLPNATGMFGVSRRTGFQRRTALVFALRIGASKPLAGGFLCAPIAANQGLQLRDCADHRLLVELVISLVAYLIGQSTSLSSKAGTASDKHAFAQDNV
ncbi:hypothetical protein [Specibacter sp. NPDC078709]|uniref:hypothetical protein n=1 Tax=Specibacter sp. NPDC078709 TaxID=3154364 RepID=UPI00343A5E19